MPMAVDFILVREYAKAHGVAERTVRNYCAQGKLEGAKVTRVSLSDWFALSGKNPRV